MHLNPIGREKLVRDFQSSPLSIVPFEVAWDLDYPESISRRPPILGTPMFRAASKFVMRPPQLRRLYAQV